MLSIIAPALNEGKNLPELAERIFNSVPKDSELIIVDDNSQDNTAETAKKLSQKFNLTLLSRPKRLGLSSAVIDGFKLAKGNILAVIDADLQHPPEALSGMLARIETNCADFVVGSRLVAGGGSKDWPWYRKIISLVARIPAMPLTKVMDLTSGFFMLKKEVIEGVALNPIGFKICLEILCRGKYRRVEEYPIIFGERRQGKSKLGSKQTFEYLVQLMGLYLKKKA
ncbi:hypothetical protein A2276_01080 [candidate division WOR-1 bacterium RIFOXYA12_FULL_43_27]|uniref:Glycosyltransferase 2-like domain-containing protein n=1 Tax=candidate division WOR-1 bacterium RIFOXYC2_FULL_46_14 TaxID=1802587 RepID=A0A1F4U4Z5_UNCSA|nr:MAG: hypothetical protein A2276_01080 [candidate division WOR-1 bacterium RIFOXYA12_FULL_43_27]OGC20721.1 MAG: hypothetical protein A2292_06795 [candidate division WOR-1 bacterium RIFOXYB2_FULL_46_45]OGC31542.1 MAG: hypothetical protein A2232_04655 [candidate division WOR-1 bacterium RIFOXYA2_FULL_46_56]OGC39949.1 MAG: hypothetical protein A2438_05495 [candidate division WOR-1 bacterium RIFOXYC2_FULL_46_14]